MPNVSMEVLHISYLNEKILPDEIQASSFQYRLASDARVKYGLTFMKSVQTQANESSPTPTISGRRVVVCKKRPGTCKRMPLRSVVLAGRLLSNFRAALLERLLSTSVLLNLFLTTTLTIPFIMMLFITPNTTPLTLKHPKLFAPGSCNVFKPIMYRALLARPPFTIEHNLAALSVPVLKQCAVALPGTKVQRGSKAVLVRAILQSFQTARSEFTGLSCACATSRLHDVQLPSSYVAEVLRRPPPAAYAVHPCLVSPIPWTSLSTEELVRRLLKLSVDTLTNSIHLLPLFRRPAINSRSRAKMCNGLAVGSHVLSAIWLSYFPFEHPFAHPDSHYILTVLEVEYGPDVVRSLSQEVQSPANRLKMMRREQRNIHLREEVQLSLQRQQQWPVLVPNET
ncbi:hypothetical protein DEU56DRAFT_759973, partial [Suillus clintonianus]|uniref:uncharacterized protein n=1 Tax=Suillus clintonianus TaxID=1904413 RepID=UPI001B878151